MRRRLVFSPRAAVDLEEIGDYIARDNPDRARSFVAELLGKCHDAAASPSIYPAREDLGRGVRIAIHRRYLVLFREVSGEGVVRIERVLHGARYLPGLSLG